MSTGRRDAIAVFVLVLVVFSILLYVSQFIADRTVLTVPNVTKEQAIGIAENYLRSQLPFNITIQTEQQLEAKQRLESHDPTPVNPVFLGYYHPNDTIFRVDNTTYQIVYNCGYNGCIVGTTEFRNALKGHLFYDIELGWQAPNGIPNGFEPIFVDALNGNILWPAHVSSYHPLLPKANQTIQSKP